MSYCRWSTDDYSCELYVYESDEGFVIHVGATRRGDVELPAPVHLTSDVTSAETVSLGGEFSRALELGAALAYVKRHQNVQQLLENTPRSPIGLPHDGASFVEATAAACADRVDAVALLGYRVPSEVAHTLRAEEVMSNRIAQLHCPRCAAECDHEVLEEFEGKIRRAMCVDCGRIAGAWGAPSVEA